MVSLLSGSLALRVKKQLIMVMGAQRSGTTALFRSLAHDRSLTSFHESAEDALYYLYRLRPVRETAPILNAAPGTVLLKPITETLDRSLEELKTEYANYALKFVWIYRDPVNVLHSMSRKGWLPCALDGEPGAGTWVARNQLALRFQKDHPAAIAIVRYEDLVSDPKIFRSLCKSLDVDGAPVFREDRGSGRSDLPLSVQRAIEAATGATLRALDSVRTFRPGRLHRWKSAAMAKLWRPALRSTSATVSSPSSEWKKNVAAAQPTLPANLEGLIFWLDAGRLSPHKGRIQHAEESGPLRLQALADGQPPFCIPFLNGQSALFFPTSKATERQLGEHGLLRFVVPATGKCPLMDDSFSVWALIKPHIPPEPHQRQERTIVARIHSGDANAEFILEWDRALRASRAILRTNDRYDSVATEPSSHPHQHWRMIYFQLQDGDDSQLLISADGIESVAPLTGPAASLQSPPEPGWTIELGGSEAEPGALFYGAIAEVILFGRRLRRTEQFAIAGYLKQKYQL
jgi:hypothetical protein